MAPMQRDRRRFLKEGASLAGLALAAPEIAAAAGVGQSKSIPGTISEFSPTGGSVLYGERSRFITSVRVIDTLAGHESHGSAPGVKPPTYRPDAKTPLRDSVGSITPSSLHFTTAHGYAPPDINPDEHKLVISGMVDRPSVFTMRELKRLPFVTRVHFLECVGGVALPFQGKTVTDTHGRTACSEWTGVPLSLVLKEVGVHNQANWIVGIGSEAGQHAKSVPMSKAMDDCLLVYAQNGEAVRPDQGFPLRLLVPGFEGLYNVKWLKRIQVVDQNYSTFQEQGRCCMNPELKNRWAHFDFGPKSVITFPAGEDEISKNEYLTITGLAWSGGGAIRRVEVSADGGRTWTDANLQGTVHRKAHVRFVMGWKWNGEETTLVSRCTDELGQVQPSVEAYAKFFGRTVEELARRGGGAGHVNFQMPWTLTRDGRVHNGLAGFSV